MARTKKSVAEQTSTTTAVVEKKMCRPRITQKAATPSDKPVRKPRTKKPAPVEEPIPVVEQVDEKNPDGYIHLSNSKNWSNNRGVLLSIGATESQAEALHNRKFRALPLWARKRIKRQLRRMKPNISPVATLAEVKPYFFRHLGREEMSKLSKQFPKQNRSLPYGREAINNRLVIGDPCAD